MEKQVHDRLETGLPGMQGDLDLHTDDG